MAAHRYWRLYIAENWVSSYTVLADMELRATVGGADLTNTVGGTPSASRAYSPASYAFDDTTANAYVADSPAPVWVKWDFGAGNDQSVGEVVVVNGGGSGNWSSLSYVKAATLQFSDDDALWYPHIYVAMPQAAGAVAIPYIELVPTTIVVSAPMGLLQIFFGGSSSLQGASPLLAAYSGAAASLTPPSPRLFVAAGYQVALTAPSPTLYATAYDSTGELSATLTAPSPTLSAYAGASSELTAPKQTLNSAGTVTGWASATPSAPSPTLAITSTTSGMATAAIKAPSPNLVGYSGAVCSITLTGSPTLQASATVGGIGGAALSCPLFELTASATAQNHGGADLLAPSPRMGQTAQAWLAAPGARLTAIGSAVITATYEAYAVNLKHTARPGVEPVDEATRYTNFPFTHVIRHKGSYYGANSTGLYLLEGTTDDATPITWAVKTAMTDFKSPQRKTVASAYFGGRLGPADTITLHAGEGAQTQSYSYTTPRGALAQNYRQAFGKGIKQHRYYALAASGNGEMALDNIDLDVHNLTRRI